MRDHCRRQVLERSRSQHSAGEQFEHLQGCHPQRVQIRAQQCSLDRNDTGYSSQLQLFTVDRSTITRSYLSVDILSYAAMKLSGFPPQRVIGLGTFLDSCRLQYMIAQKLGISANAVQASVICENGPTSGNQLLNNILLEYFNRELL